ncbi:MAG: 23S rRNA pseudouridine(1911/1915/1917) synthase RluD [Gammaproteobacteria bacterium]|nr:23S rRNA pseudouridine(1911/1915/1917) synthase RluD [Gammaproteobacteria bacterium]
MPKTASKAAVAPVPTPIQTRRHELELPPHPGGLRLDQALSLALPQYSRSRLAAWIKAGAVRLDGKTARPRDAVYGGETVRVEAELPPDDSVAPERMPIKIAYRDKHLFVIDKPAGLVVHPGAGNRASTLQNGLLALDPKLATVPRAGIVHRIDKDTSGLLVVARTIEAHAALVEMLREHQVQREYQALCVGAVTGGGTVDAPIGRHRTDRLKMTVRPDGKAAITHYRLAERFAHHTLLTVQLETGRTHQIRVHLAHIGHPLVGDPQYGGRRQLTPGATPGLRDALKAFGRQALHAGRLAFEHPVTGKTIDVSSPLPVDFRRLLAVLREG